MKRIVFLLIWLLPVISLYAQPAAKSTKDHDRARALKGLSDITRHLAEPDCETHFLPLPNGQGVVTYLKDQRTGKLYYVNELALRSPEMLGIQDSDGGTLKNHGELSFDLVNTATSLKARDVFYETMRKKGEEVEDLWSSIHPRGNDLQIRFRSPTGRDSRFPFPWTRVRVSIDEPEFTVMSALFKAQAPHVDYSFKDPCSGRYRVPSQAFLDEGEKLLTRFEGRHTGYSPYSRATVARILDLKNQWEKTEKTDLKSRDAILESAVRAYLSDPTPEMQTLMKQLRLDRDGATRLLMDSLKAGADPSDVLEPLWLDFLPSRLHRQFFNGRLTHAAFREPGILYFYPRDLELPKGGYEATERYLAANAGRLGIMRLSESEYERLGGRSANPMRTIIRRTYYGTRDALFLEDYAK